LRCGPATTLDRGRELLRDGTADAAWRAGIIVNLLSDVGYYHIALRDFGLVRDPLTLGRLASVYDPPAPFRSR
jgi:hypothetical protein